MELPFESSMTFFGLPILERTIASGLFIKTLQNNSHTINPYLFPNMSLVFRIVKKIIEAGFIVRVEITGNAACKWSYITIEEKMLLVPKSKRVNNIVVKIPVFTRCRGDCGGKINNTKSLLFYPVKSRAFSTDKKIARTSFSHHINDTNTRQIFKNKCGFNVVIL